MITSHQVFSFAPVVSAGAFSLSASARLPVSHTCNPPYDAAFLSSRPTLASIFVDGPSIGSNGRDEQPYVLRQPIGEGSR